MERISSQSFLYSHVSPFTRFLRTPGEEGLTGSKGVGFEEKIGDDEVGMQTDLGMLD